MPLPVNPKVGLIPFFIALIVSIVIVISTFIYGGYCLGTGQWHVLAFVPGFFATIVGTVTATILLAL